MLKTLTFDIETNGLLDDLTAIHCIVTRDADGERRYRGASISAGIEALQKARLLVGHNVLCFDLPAIEKLYPRFKRPAKIWDTMTTAAVLWPDIREEDFKRLRSGFPGQLIGQHSLKAWGHRLGVLKGNYGATTDWAEWSQEMEDYCAQDVAVTVALYKRQLAARPSAIMMDLEHQFQALIHTQERRGVGFDAAAARVLYATLSKRRLALETELQELFPPAIETLKTPSYYYFDYEDGRRYEQRTKGEARRVLRGLERGKRGRSNSIQIQAGPLRTKAHPFNPASTDQIAARLIETYGWKPTQFTEKGMPQVTETILDQLPFPPCKSLSEYLMLAKRIGQLAEGNQAWLKVERGGRIYGRVHTNGAVTGRCSHTKPNMAQVPRCGSPYGAECRALFTPSPGMVLVGWDASGLELRCLAHFMAKFDGGAYATILTTGDIHTANMEAAGLPSRDTAKTFIYGFLYGAGDGKIGEIIGAGPKAGRKLRAQFLAKFPALRRLKETLAATVNSRGRLRGLDGRRLPVRSEHTALNALLQSAGAVLMKKAAVLQLDELTKKLGLKLGEDFAFVLNIHDEIQIETKPHFAETVGKAGVNAIKGAGKFFGFRCPLDGEWKSGANWAETH